MLTSFGCISNPFFCLQLFVPCLNRPQSEVCQPSVLGWGDAWSKPAIGIKVAPVAKENCQMLKCRCWQLEGWGCAAKARGWDSGLLSSLCVLDPSAKPIFYFFGPSSILKLPLDHHVMALLMFLLKFSMAFYMRSKLGSPEYRAFPLSSIICLFLTSLAWFITTSFLCPLTNTIFHSCQTSCSSQNVQFPLFHASVFLLTLAPSLECFSGVLTRFLPDCGVAEQVGL